MVTTKMTTMTLPNMLRICGKVKVERYFSLIFSVSRRKEEKKKKKHHHHHHHHHRHGSSAPNDGLDDDHLEGTTVRKFYALIDQVIEAAEEIDLSTFKGCFDVPMILRISAVNS